MPQRKVDMVSHPPHYSNPNKKFETQLLEVIFGSLKPQINSEYLLQTFTFNNQL